VAGLLVAWCGGVNNTIMSEVTPPHLRTTIFGLDRLLEGLVAPAGAGLAGLLAERVFGFVQSSACGGADAAAAALGNASLPGPPASPTLDEPQWDAAPPPQQNADALGRALAVTMCVPWTLCFMACTSSPHDSLPDSLSAPWCPSLPPAPLARSYKPDWTHVADSFLHLYYKKERQLRWPAAEAAADQAPRASFCGEEGSGARSGAGGGGEASSAVGAVGMDGRNQALSPRGAKARVEEVQLMHAHHPRSHEPAQPD